MNVSFTKPQMQLSEYIDTFWIFESGSGVPMTDGRTIVPDGRAKIIIPYKNPLSVSADNGSIYTGEHQIFLCGIQNNPRTICSPPTDTATIGVELTPKGLYRFFKLSMSEITDRLYSFDELFGLWGVGLQHKLSDLGDPFEKIAALQTALTHRLHQNTTEFALLDHTVDLISQSHGMIRIAELAAQTGYSRRYLDMLFKQHIGLSPKSLAGIMKFQRIYRGWVQAGSTAILSDDFYAYYYDQAHFIKEFKRFTGHAPQKYTELRNEFARAFYQK